jgi:nucleoid-associated protein YgaU
MVYLQWFKKNLFNYSLKKHVMGLISFIKGAGEKVFGKSDAKKAEEKSVQEKQMAEAVSNHINKYGLAVKDVKVVVEDDKVILSGAVPSMFIKNKVIVAAGNIEGIALVEDLIQVTEPVTITPPEPEKQFYTVKKGDFLSKIARTVYGDGNKYLIIFEANKPMLSHPDKIYPGQVLIIPLLD